MMNSHMTTTAKCYDFKRLIIVWMMALKVLGCSTYLAQRSQRNIIFCPSSNTVFLSIFSVSFSRFFQNFFMMRLTVFSFPFQNLFTMFKIVFSTGLFFCANIASLLAICQSFLFMLMVISYALSAFLLSMFMIVFFSSCPLLFRSFKIIHNSIKKGTIINTFPHFRNRINGEIPS